MRLRLRFGNWTAHGSGGGRCDSGMTVQWVVRRAGGLGPWGRKATDGLRGGRGLIGGRRRRNGWGRSGMGDWVGLGSGYHEEDGESGWKKEGGRRGTGC